MTAKDIFRLFTRSSIILGVEFADEIGKCDLLTVEKGSPFFLRVGFSFMERKDKVGQ
jgi:hypothetical protein